MRCSSLPYRPVPVLAAAALFAALTVASAGAHAQVPGRAPARQAGINPPKAGAVPTAQRLTVGDGTFLLDGQPFQILSGEMHYPRVPREYWRDRLRKARAMGLNTISTYVFWNLHEPRPGVYDFAGQKDVASFIRMAGEEGLHVILRPGPYVCAEWDLGGYPAWLLADTSLVLRSTDPRFTAPAERWLLRLGRELAPLTAGRGGPIVAVQVENEYGSFDSDSAYKRWSLEAVRRAGLGDGTLLYTADGPDQLAAGTLPELPAVVNFGPGNADSAFAKLARFRKGAPLMSGEYWAGWFDDWGHPHAQLDTERQVKELDWMLGRGASVNLYMFHGGTTFGFMAGANGSAAPRGEYKPDVSSYDYASALDESGRPTPKYEAFRALLAKHAKAPLPPVPVTPAPIAVPAFELTQVSPLSAHLGTGIASERPRPLESFGQSYGYILYRTRVAGPAAGELVLDQPRDYARVYLDGKPAGTIDRRLRQDRISVTVPADGATLEILVENTARINFAKALREERKGITRAVTLDGKELTGWRVFPLPMAEAPTAKAVSGSGSRSGSGAGVLARPAFYRGTFRLARTGDTFLDLRGWGKGTVWVNGHHLGRFWSIGPQQTLYLPGPWLRQVNEVVVFSFDPPARRTLSGLTAPVLDELHDE